jgi:hypothetical protein
VKTNSTKLTWSRTNDGEEHRKKKEENPLDGLGEYDEKEGSWGHWIPRSLSV